MTIYYVDFSRADDTGDGLSWAAAKKTIQGALTVATSGTDIIYWDKDSAETVGADTTLTVGGNVSVISVDKDNSDAVTAGATIGAQATNYSITLSGAFKTYWHGVTFQTGTNTSATESVNIGGTGADGVHHEFENCTFNINANSNNLSILALGPTATTTMNGFILLRNCTIKLTGAAQNIRLRGKGEIVGLTLDAASTSPNDLFRSDYAGCSWDVSGGNFTPATGNLVADLLGTGTAEFRFANCKLGSGMAFMAAPTTVVNRGQTTVWAFNCASGDTHYAMFHGDAFGYTEVSTTIYADDGAQYDGTNRCSWKITTRESNCSYYTPYVSPWIDKYHSGTSAISLSLECLRDGSTTLYQNDEVWGEFSYQGTSGSTKSTVVNDRMALLGTPDDQTSSSIAWTGGTTPGKFKLESGSVTPAEIGHLRARVVVGEPNITVYVDPQIRVA